ncbi:MAG: hypothetical protein U1E38_06195 [Rhodospirillales bacterium]
MVDFATTRPSLPPRGYYAPNFRVEVEGQELDPRVKGDVLDLKVTADLENMTSADITFNNWDDQRFDFKYSDTAALDIGNRVHIQLGYADRLLSMMHGQINSLTPRFPQSGASTIAVGVLDGMQLLKGRKPAEGELTKYTEKTDWQIAQIIAERNGLQAEVSEVGETHAEVVQKNQDDAQFLMERAKRIDFDCYIFTDPATRQSVLRFVEPTDTRVADRIRQFTFKWGENLNSFSPTLTLSDQVSQLTVRGWNDRTKQAISYTASASDLPGASTGGTSGPAAAQDRLRGRQEMVVDFPVSTEQEARELAISLLRERAYEFITGSGEILGFPDLRPGDNIDLLGLGRRFGGTYYVRKVGHRLGSGGFFTTFDVRRVFDGGVPGR